MVLRNGTVESYVRLAVDHQQVEIFFEIGSQHFEVREVVDPPSIDSLFENAVEEFKVEVFGGVVLFDEVFDDF